jgi:SH3-like domain-containing protein
LQSGELFNGDVIQIVGKNGSWFRVTTSEGRNGWVSRQYVNQRCGL